MNNHQQTVRAGTIARVIALCLLLGGAGVGYVFQKSQIYTLTQQLKERDALVEELEDEARDRRRDVELLTSTARLEDFSDRFQLNLVKPDPRMVRTRPEPPVAGLPRPIELVNAR